MNRVLCRRLPREFKKNFPRYMALILLASLGMFLVVSLVAAAETVIQGSYKKQKKIKLKTDSFRFLFRLPMSRRKTSQIQAL